jgi:AraC-like DNA-binding protein
MVLLTYIPQQPLADFVELLWYCDGLAPPHPKERVLPMGAMQLVINLRDDPLRNYDRQHTDRFQSYRGPLLCGPRSEYSVIDTASQVSSMGVFFKPGGAFPFLGVPASELHNLDLSLEMLWKDKADELHDRLLKAKTPTARFHILEQALLARAARRRGRHPAVTFALREFQRVPYERTIASVSEHIGLSARRFIQVFHDQVGLTPKLYCRVRRFQEALRLIGDRQSLDWTALALTCGYFDQAHFIHDFRAFSGLSPGAYRALRGEHQNHVPFTE